VVFGRLIPALAFNGFVYVIVFPAVAVLLLREIWAKGWCLPETEAPKVERCNQSARRPLGSTHEPITVRRLVRWRLVLVGSVAFA
jgi:hypothetical protein